MQIALFHGAAVLNFFGSPLGAILHIPGQGAPGACFFVAVGVKGVATVLGHIRRGSRGERGTRPFIGGETAESVVVVGILLYYSDKR